MPQITISISDDDSAEHPDTPWTASVLLTEDSGRARPIGSSDGCEGPREALEAALRAADDDPETAWVARHLLGDGQPYVLLEGGLVQNDPALPVIDLDHLDLADREPDAGALVELHNRMLAADPALFAEEITRCRELVTAHGTAADRRMLDNATD